MSFLTIVGICEANFNFRLFLGFDGLQRGFSEALVRLPSFLTIVRICEANFNFRRVSDFNGLHRGFSEASARLKRGFDEKMKDKRAKCRLFNPKNALGKIVGRRKMKRPEAPETRFAQV